MIDFSGVYTALITPFTDLGTVDYKSLERIVNQQIEAGIDGLVPCGTTGESPTLSHEEHDRVIAQTIKYADGRVPVIAGTGSNCTTEAIRLSQHAEDSGADAVLLVNPYYNKPTQKGLYLHFKAIANSVKIPCILYNIKGRTGVNIETETLVNLAEECPNIVAVKEASGSIEQMKAVIAATADGFSVLSGDDNLAIELIREGGDGVISVASNLFPHEMPHLKATGMKLTDLKDGLLHSSKPASSKPIPSRSRQQWHASDGAVNHSVFRCVLWNLPSTGKSCLQLSIG